MADKGRFVWHELATRDPEKAGDFYSKVIDWVSIPWGEGNVEYSLFRRSDDDEGAAAGMLTMRAEEFPPEVPSHWIGYIGIDDVDTAAERVKELGGQIYHGPVDIEGVGRFAVAADPQGGVFALFRGTMEGDDTSPQIGEFSWSDLAAADYAPAFDFYKDLFDWEIEHDVEMTGEMTYRIFRPKEGTRPIGGMYNKSPEQPATAWMFYARVADINEAADRVKENGGTVLNGPLEVPGGDQVAYCLDPEGTPFALHWIVAALSEA